MDRSAKAIHIKSAPSITGTKQVIQRRIVKLEDTGKPRPSPIAVWYGSLDAWGEKAVLPGVESGAPEADDMVEVVAALRRVGGAVCGLTVNPRGW